MTSRDVHDVLNLPSDHSGVGRPSKKHKSSTARPNLKGLAREVQNLSGDNPIAIVPEVSFFKKRRLASRKPATRWELKPFMNSARADDGALVLRHWKRKTEDGPPADGEAQPAEDGAEANRMAKVEKLEDSAFAKYNVKAQIPQYTDDQYHSVLQSSTWTKEETDYLLELVRDFDLRWAIIWDRYDFQPKVEGVNGADTALVAASKPRTMEDLKARYYEISAKMMAVQTPVQYMTRPEFELYEMIQNFDPEQERKRKQFALNTMARSKDEAREEESLLLEVKRILARTERFNEERRELYNRLDYPATETDINSFKSSAGLQNLLQTLMTSDKAKKQRNKAMAPADGASPSSAVPPSAVSETAPNGHNRRESVAASAASAAHRDSDARTPATPAEPTPTTATNKKKGAPQPERRKLTQQEEQVYGVSYHDRLGSGPTFRYEKINKLYSHKSGQQQMRITNVLSELGIPPRLVMPTAQVTAQFELLWSAVTALVDLRKVSDRLDGEIKVEEAKKAERDKARGVVPPSNAEKEDGDRDKDKENEKDLAERSKVKEEEVGETPGLPGGDGDGGVEGGGGGGDGEGAENADGGENAKSVTDEPGEKQQEDEEGDKRPGSSGGASHKRSASVLSSVSDKSAKRQKK
ncbi:putative SWR1-complex protein 4 [Cladorrhinum samala]|uniref:SWR1-complex protein 4 n=1 Tax=Cladorrhinum samala TaxID=585594 RepID=A0AAV9I4K1_9PEZI|nr:putative SWR1-complex protein 4 [Cladorrhinum samala]